MVMGRRRKPVTKDLIRKYFGRGVRVRTRWFADGYKVLTETGGEVLISDDEMTIRSGGEDVYHALTLLGDELWGKITAYGPRESVMAWVAHGEALGVNVRPGIKRGWFWRFIMTTLSLTSAANMVFGDGRGLSVLLFSLLILWLMRRSAKRREREFAEEIGYHFPRVHGRAGAAANEDLEREGWL